MRKLFVALFTGLVALSAVAQEADQKDIVEEKKITNMEGSTLEFTVLMDVDNTPVANQNRTGTCWSFSTLSFFESEILRTSGKEVNLSEMWIVRHTYEEKAKQYVRYNGKHNFSQGGAFHDVTNMARNYGMVPESEYTGLNYGEEKHIHSELATVLSAYLDGVIKNKNGHLSTKWFEGFQGILDAYLGARPESFEVDGKKYTPETYMTEYLKFDPDSYVGISSYTHHDYYKPFIIEVEDNWSNDEVINLPLDEYMGLMESSLMAGYSFAWASDVSEKGFQFKRGLASYPNKGGSFDAKAWRKLSNANKDSIFGNEIEEETVTAERRQTMYDNYETTDDHGMHAVGLVQDQHGKKYWTIKNSWGTESNDCDGYFYASEAFVRAKTMDILIHKDALSKDMKKKLGLK